VFAAGDVTTFPVKQGGIAAQQAESAAHTIAAEAGVDVKPYRFRPVLRGYLLTGAEPRYLRRELRTGLDTVSPDPLWWPPAKIVGRYLSPFLAELAGGDATAEPPSRPDALRVDVEVESDDEPARPWESPQPEVRDGDGSTVGDVMSPEFLTARADELLGDAAARMREHDAGSVLVVDGDRLIGILTSRDLLRAFAARAHPAEAQVRHWMTAEPIAVSATTTLGTAAFLMTERNIHHLPVVDGDRPIGMVGLRAAARAARWNLGIGLGF
jgi:CBS domain-containing protein